jgi:hypothetical protein
MVDGLFQVRDGSDEGGVQSAGLPRISLKTLQEKKFVSLPRLMKWICNAVRDVNNMT